MCHQACQDSALTFLFHGEESVGVPQAEIEGVRTSMVTAANFNCRTACKTTALEIAYGEYGDPAITYANQLFRDVQSSLRGGVIRTWIAAAEGARMFPAQRWNGTGGIVSAAVNSFIDWGWVPHSPLQLESKDGTRFSWDLSWTLPWPP